MYNLKHFLNNSRKAAVIGTAAAAVALAAFTAKAEAAETPLNGWDESGHWYENGVKQGIYGRGKEIYDPETNAWYWLDAVQGGAVARNKDVYQDSYAGDFADNTKWYGYGKWVRYDENGHMVKGWTENENGKYYFDPVTGAMAKGTVVIDGETCYFNQFTGILLDEVFVTEADGNEYWYEKGVKQGTEGRGKEIYDAATNAWYWLDAIDGGRKAKDKDVYQESSGGKWVRYRADGSMVKGLDYSVNNDGTYYFDPVTGAMAKGTVVIDGITYFFDDITGKLEVFSGPAENGRLYSVELDSRARAQSIQGSNKMSEEDYNLFAYRCENGLAYDNCPITNGIAARIFRIYTCKGSELISPNGRRMYPYEYVYYMDEPDQEEWKFFYTIAVYDSESDVTTVEVYMN